MEEQLRNFWKTVFTDTDEFIDIFFTHIYKEENAVTIEEHGRLVAILHIVPYKMLHYGKELPIAYIYAVGVLPECRGRGLMRRLMLKAEKVIESRNFVLSALIPADRGLFEAYRKFGYTEAFRYGMQSFAFLFTVKPPSIPYVIVRPADADDTELFAFFDAKTREREVCVLHDYDDYCTLLDIYTVLAAFDDDGQPVGILFATKDHDGNTVLVNELLCLNEVMEQCLLREVSRLYGLARVRVRRPPMCNGEEAVPYGMVKAIGTDNDKTVSLPGTACMSLMLD
jgi:predicted acetyltransferase